MVKVTTKLARWRLRLSKIELYIICHTAKSIRKLTRCFVSRLNVWTKLRLNDEVPVLTTRQEVLACAPKTRATDLGLNKKVKCPFVPFVWEVCLMKGITDNDKMEVQTLVKFTSAQSTDPCCLFAFASVGDQVLALASIATN